MQTERSRLLNIILVRVLRVCYLRLLNDSLVIRYLWIMFKILVYKDAIAQLKKVKTYLLVIKLIECDRFC